MLESGYTFSTISRIAEMIGHGSPICDPLLFNDESFLLS